MAEDENAPVDQTPEETGPSVEDRIESIYESFGGRLTRDEIRDIFGRAGAAEGEPVTSGRPSRPVVSQGRGSDEELYNGPDNAWAQRFAAQHDNKAPTWEDRADAMWGARFAQVVGHGPRLNDWRMHYYVKYNGDDFDSALKNVQHEVDPQAYHAVHPVQIYADDIDPMNLRAIKVPKATSTTAAASTTAATRAAATGGGGGGGITAPTPGIPKPPIYPEPTGMGMYGPQDILEREAAKQQAWNRVNDAFAAEGRLSGPLTLPGPLPLTGPAFTAPPPVIDTTTGLPPTIPQSIGGMPPSGPVGPGPNVGNVLAIPGQAFGEANRLGGQQANSFLDFLRRNYIDQFR